MNAKIESVKAYVKEHKKKILMVSGAVLAGGLCLLLYSRDDHDDDDCDIGDQPGETHFEPNITVGLVGDAVRYENGVVELWMDGIQLDDLGKLGSEISNNIPDLPDENEIWALLSVHKKDNLD